MAAYSAVVTVHGTVDLERIKQACLRYLDAIQKEEQKHENQTGVDPAEPVRR